MKKFFDWLKDKDWDSVVTRDDEKESDFSYWLKQELKMRAMRIGELAHYTKLKPSVIVDMMNGKQLPDKATALVIARTFRFAPEYVFEIAGVLPPQSLPPGRNSYIGQGVSLMRKLMLSSVSSSTVGFKSKRSYEENRFDLARFFQQGPGGPPGDPGRDV